MAIPTVIATDTANHAVCVVQVLKNGDRSVDKAEALNSYGRFQPVVRSHVRDLQLTSCDTASTLVLSKRGKQAPYFLFEQQTPCNTLQYFAQFCDFQKDISTHYLQVILLLEWSLRLPSFLAFYAFKGRAGRSNTTLRTLCFHFAAT